MAEVTWFKVLTDIFSDDKIKILQSMPEGDSLLVMWFKVLAQAGKTNDGGYIYLKKNIPYTAAMLSTLFGKQQQLVELAMRTFTEFGMIDIDDKGYVFVTNWEKHQSIDALEKIKEQDRLRAANYRERKRLELNGNHVTLTLPSQSNHAIEVEVELDLELDKEKQNTTTEFSPFIVLEKEYCKLHRKLDIHLKPKEIMAMEQLISGGVPLEFIVTNMKQMFQKKTEAGEKVTSFSYYSEAINDSWNNRNVMQFQTKKKDRFNDILDQWEEKKKNESTTDN